MLGCGVQVSAAAGGGAGGLTSEERADLAARHRFDPLPEGYTYDGYRYYDAFGDASPTHPCMPEFVARFVAERAQAAHEAEEQRRAAQQAAAPRSVHVTALAAAPLSAF